MNSHKRQSRAGSGIGALYPMIYTHNDHGRPGDQTHNANGSASFLVVAAEQYITGVLQAVVEAVAPCIAIRSLAGCSSGQLGVVVPLQRLAECGFSCSQWRGALGLGVAPHPASSFHRPFRFACPRTPSAASHSSHQPNAASSSPMSCSTTMRRVGHQTVSGLATCTYTQPHKAPSMAGTMLRVARHRLLRVQGSSPRQSPVVK